MENIWRIRLNIVKLQITLLDSVKSRVYLLLKAKTFSAPLEFDAEVSCVTAKV